MCLELNYAEQSWNISCQENQFSSDLLTPAYVRVARTLSDGELILEEVEQQRIKKSMTDLSKLCLFNFSQETSFLDGFERRIMDSHQFIMISFLRRRNTSLDQSKRERFGILKLVLEFCIRSSCANTRGGFYCFFLQILGYDSLFQIYSQHFPHALCQHCSFSHDLQRPGLDNLDSEPRGITCLWQMCVCQSWMRFGRFANGGRHSANKTSSSVISGPPLIPACPAAASLALSPNRISVSVCQKSA